MTARDERSSALCAQMFFHVWEHNPNVVLGMWSEFIARQHTSGAPAPAHVISDMGLVRFLPLCPAMACII